MAGIQPRRDYAATGALARRSHVMKRAYLALVLVLGAAGAPGLAWAAHSYGTCTGYIDALPATIATSGTWCLRSDEMTAQSSGAAISVEADFVVIDCNDFRVSGIDAGPATLATGIAVRDRDRHNVVVRNCHLEGFRYGMAMMGFSHLVEDNTVDASTFVGISVRGSFSVVRDNLVRETGGAPGMGEAYGIAMLGVFGTALDNTVAGVSAFMPDKGRGGRHHDDREDWRTYGILLHDGVVQGNRVIDLDATATGIRLLGDGVVRDNVVFHGDGKWAVGIDGGGNRCTDNDVAGYRHRFRHCVGGED
jgi:hypothetical protein